MALLALGIGSPAAAQINSVTAFPLAVGNAWEFRTEGSPLLRWDVVGERLVAGQRLALMQFNGGPTCGVLTRAEPSSVYYTLVDPTAPGLPCAESEASTRFPRPRVGADGFYISGPPAGTVTFWVSGDLVTGPTWFVANRPASTASLVNSWSLMDGVGPMAFYRTTPEGTPPQGATFQYLLTYARVGARTVGQSSIPGPFAAYLPLGVGDRWDYTLRGGARGAETPAGAASLTVTAVTAPTPLTREAQIAVVRRDAAGAETVASCTLRTTAYPQESLGQWALCAGDDVLPYQFALRSATGPGPFDIGGLPYSAAQAAGTETTVQSLPGAAVTTVRTVAAAQGVGILSWAYSRTSVPQTGSDAYRSATLAYARVGGTEYGRQVVAAGDVPAAAVRSPMAYPNPARHLTRIEYAVSTPGPARILVADALGRTARTVDLGPIEAGDGSALLDLRGLAAGVYLARFESGASVQTLRLVVVQ